MLVFQGKIRYTSNRIIMEYDIEYGLLGADLLKYLKH